MRYETLKKNSKKKTNRKKRYESTKVNPLTSWLWEYDWDKKAKWEKKHRPTLKINKYWRMKLKKYIEKERKTD